MSDNHSNVNNAVSSAAIGVAHVTNVAVCYEAIERILTRHPSLPGIGVFYGRSGDGKSVAACYIANKTRAYYVQATSICTKKSFLESVLREMTIPAAKTANEMLGQIAEELAKSGRPLIIDEFDYLATGQKVEMIRDIYESSQGTILVIGEELLPKSWNAGSGSTVGCIAGCLHSLLQLVMQHNWLPSMRQKLPLMVKC